jgi:aryl-alcohol dehydrogenase-like predicted oxidoreductase
MSKLSIGSAQFGLDYGVTNSSGKVPLPEVCNILSLSKKSGISSVDTARLYGVSEEVLGQSDMLSDFKVTTKVSPQLLLENSIQVGFKIQIDESLKNLRLNSVYGLLCHDADFFIQNTHEVVKSLEQLRSNGFVQKIGCSVYGPEQVIALLKSFTPDIIQVPANVFDQRFHESKVLDILKMKNVEIHVRSAFLQGILLEKPEGLHSYFSSYKKQLAQFSDACQEAGLSPLEACLKLLVDDERVAKIVVGVCSAKQLEEVLSAEKKCSFKKSFNFSIFSSQDLHLINPSLWRLR